MDRKTQWIGNTMDRKHYEWENTIDRKTQWIGNTIDGKTL